MTSLQWIGRPLQKKPRTFSPGMSICRFEIALKNELLHLFFIRLVRCLLGSTAISERKLEHGNPLTVLGIEVSLQHDGATFRPNEEKAIKWTDKIWDVLCKDCLHSGEASKLSGALQWATQHTFRRLGRAMLRPLFKQIRRRNSELTPELRLGLQWWMEVLSLGISEKREWIDNNTPPVFMYCDMMRGAHRQGRRRFCIGMARRLTVTRSRRQKS